MRFRYIENPIYYKDSIKDVAKKYNPPALLVEMHVRDSNDDIQNLSSIIATGFGQCRITRKKAEELGIDIFPLWNNNKQRKEYYCLLSIRFPVIGTEWVEEFQVRCVEKSNPIFIIGRELLFNFLLIANGKGHFSIADRRVPKT